MCSSEQSSPISELSIVVSSHHLSLKKNMLVSTAETSLIRVLWKDHRSGNSVHLYSRISLISPVSGHIYSSLSTVKINGYDR